MQWSPIKTQSPKVIIIGRPNTGKSTLFNRLLKKRRAITDPTPGVTRDSIDAECRILGRTITLVDTGGFSLTRDGIQELVREKTLAQLSGASLILFVVDIGELTKEDREFIEYLNPYRDKIILVVNKIDTDDKELLVYEKFELGFARTIGVSAEHGRNIPLLLEEIVSFIDSQLAQATSAEGMALADIRISILGKPNTGKSTLLNYILNEEKSLVSEIPGTTRDVVEGAFSFKGQTFVILDTAGIRRKNRVENSVEYYSVNRAIKSIEESDVVVLLLDVVEEFTEQDKKIAGLVERRGKGLILCLNKWDTLKKIPNQFRAIQDRIEFLFPLAETLPIIPISAKTGEGIEKLLAVVSDVRAELDKRVETAELNRALQDWTSKYNIPLKKNIKIRYMTQVSTQPVRFVLFVNSRRSFPHPYLHYLTNRIREQFGFRHVPIQIEIRKSLKKES